MPLTWKDLTTLVGLLATILTGACYVGKTYHTLDMRVAALDENIKTVMVQMEAINEVSDTKVNSRIDMIQLELKQCKCAAN